MTDEEPGGPTVRRTLEQVLRAAAVLWTGAADPPPRRQAWPSRLRWTRRIGLGRLPFGVVVACLDLIITVSLLGGTYNFLVTEVRGAVPDYPKPFLALAAAAVSVPVALRGRHPVAAWRIITVAMAVTGLWAARWLTVPYLPGGVFATMLCLYSVGVRAPRQVTAGAAAVTVAGALVMDASTGVGAALLIFVPLLLGYTVRERRATRRELAEQERRHRDAAAVLTERQRIARELHDVVAHHMSMIAIQAEAAPYTEPGMPDRTRADLAEIRATALTALTEMRRVLGVLRSEDGAETAPQPGLDRLDELVAGARGTGLTVQTALTSVPRPLPPGVDLTAYRIVQEALSNAMRHAPGCRVDIEIRGAGGAVRLSVVNGPAAGGSRPWKPSPDGGHGLIGMRERAAMLGGELAAEPVPGGGFSVIATLPVTSP